MSNHQGLEETLEGVKNPALRSFDDLDAESQDFVSALQRRNLNFFQNDPRITIANGVYMYYDGHGRILAAGAESLVGESFEEPQFDTCITWGPGAEASVAKKLIETAPEIKHKSWITTRKVLSEMPANPTLTPAVITLLRSTVAKERECWAQLDTLTTIQSFESLLALDVEAILALMCSLAGMTVAVNDPAVAAQGVPSGLYSDLIRLRELHEVIIKCAYVYDTHDEYYDYPEHQRMLGEFKQECASIVEKLLPGKLANEMERFVDQMQYLLDNDKRYSPE